MLKYFFLEIKVLFRIESKIKYLKFYMIYRYNRYVIWGFNYKFEIRYLNICFFFNKKYFM